MVVLGVVCIAISIVGYVFPDMPMLAVCIADAAAKLVCGAYMFFISKPSKFVPKSVK